MWLTGIPSSSGLTGLRKGNDSGSLYTSLNMGNNAASNSSGVNT